MVEESREDVLLRQQGEIVRQVRKLARHELVLTIALQQIAKNPCAEENYGHSCPEAYGAENKADWCAPCVARRALHDVNPPRQSSREKC